jgi:hypothetical protein
MKLHGVPFISEPSTAALSAGTSLINCGGHGINENNDVYKKICYVIFLFISGVNKNFTLNFLTLKRDNKIC